jgi:hypothetical protein
MHCSYNAHAQHKSRRGTLRATLMCRVAAGGKGCMQSPHAYEFGWMPAP